MHQIPGFHHSIGPGGLAVLAVLAVLDTHGGAGALDQPQEQQEQQGGMAVNGPQKPLAPLARSKVAIALLQPGSNRGANPTTRLHRPGTVLHRSERPPYVAIGRRKLTFYRAGMGPTQRTPGPGHRQSSNVDRPADCWKLNSVLAIVNLPSSHRPLAMAYRQAPVTTVRQSQCTGRQSRAGVARLKFGGVIKDHCLRHAASLRPDGPVQ